MKREVLSSYLVNGQRIALTSSEDWKFGKEGYRRLKHSAKSRDIPFEIQNTEELIDFWLRNPDECYWCGITINDFHGLHKQINNMGVDTYLVNKLKKLLHNYNSKFLTFDRIDSNGPYATNNLVKSCPICNFTKGSFINEEEFSAIACNVMNRIREAVRSEAKRNSMQ